MTEDAVRYRLKRLQEEGVRDGRARQATALDGYEDAVAAIQERLGDGRLDGEGRPCQVRLIYEALVRDHGYEGSYQSVVRHPRRKHGLPWVRAIRRVETPPGGQAQHDWFEERVPIGTRRVDLGLLLGTLSYSRAKFCWPSEDQTQLSWHTGHHELFRRYEGVPLWVSMGFESDPLFRGERRLTRTEGVERAKRPERPKVRVRRERRFTVWPPRLRLGSSSREPGGL